MLPLILAMLWVFILPKADILNTENAFPLFLFSIKNLIFDRIFQIVFVLICILLQSLALSFVMNKHNVLKENTHLPALMYVVLMSCFPEQLSISPMIISNFLIILFLNSVLQCYQNEKTTFHAFDAGFFIGLSALFYWPSAILILLLFVSLFSFKPFYWNEYVAAVIGLLIPFLFFSSALFWFDLFSFERLKLLFEPFIQVQISAVYNETYILLFIILSGIVLASVIKFSQEIGSFSKIKTRKFQLVLIWFVVFATLAYLVSAKKTMISLSFLSIPLTMLLSNYFISMKRSWLAEILFLSLLSAIIYNQVIHF
jgi:hypothetical protein